MVTEYKVVGKDVPQLFDLIGKPKLKAASVKNARSGSSHGAMLSLFPIILSLFSITFFTFSIIFSSQRLGSSASSSWLEQATARRARTSTCQMPLVGRTLRRVRLSTALMVTQ